MTTKELTLQVPDISCGHCKQSIESAVGEVPGVEKVEVHIEEKTVDVVLDADAVAPEKVVAAIEAVGYEVAV